MDQNLKRRLVGAVVITSLAAIFVPMLFDDPIDESGKMISELKIPDAPSNSLDADAFPLPKSIDDVVDLPEPMSLREMKGNQESASEMVRWFLQVGIFTQKSNAITLQNTIRKQGFPVTISTITGEKGQLYRVKVGPELDKKRAEAMKQKIDKLNNIKSILTSTDESFE